MIKSLLTYILVFTITGFIAYFTHNSYIENQAITLPYVLKKVYVFFVVFSFVLCVLFKIGSRINKLKEQLGFIYLGSIIFKITVFAVIFYNTVFDVALNTSQRIALLIPMAIFLFIEVFFVAKILNKTSF